MLFILLLSSQITVSLEPTSQVVRFGDSFELITTISNAQQLTLAGYQIGFGWDADSLQMPAAPFVAPTDVLAAATTSALISRCLTVIATVYAERNR